MELDLYPRTFGPPRRHCLWPALLGLVRIKQSAREGLDPSTGQPDLAVVGFGGNEWCGLVATGERGASFGPAVQQPDGRDNSKQCIRPGGGAGVASNPDGYPAGTDKLLLN